MMAYDENGVLREFGEYDNIVVCKHCKKMYHQHTEEQVPGFRDIDDDICPYCKESNGRSGDVEFFNRALTQEELDSMKKE